MQARSKTTRGFVMLLMAVLATLASVAPSLAGVGPGPWPR